MLLAGTPTALPSAWRTVNLDVDFLSSAQAPYNALIVDARDYPRVFYAKSVNGVR